MNPAHENSAECSATEMNYGTKIDVVLEDENGNRQYVYCVVEFVGTAPEWVNDGYQIVGVIVYD